MLCHVPVCVIKRTARVVIDCVKHILCVGTIPGIQVSLWYSVMRSMFWYVKFLCVLMCVVYL